MIVNSEGKVALKWAIPQRNPKPVKIDATGQVYIFSPNLNIFLAWIDKENIPGILKVKDKLCNCSNGTYKQAYTYANLLDVQLWLTGGRNPLPEGYMEVSSES